MNMPLIPNDIVASAFKTEKEVQADAEKEAKRQERLEKLIDHVKKHSPTGKKAIEDAEKKGVTFCMDSINQNTLGVFQGSSNAIVLNEMFDDSQLISTLVHESRHANQTPLHDIESNTYSMVVGVRALEADAMAHECAAVYEMAQSASVMPSVYFAVTHEAIMDAFMDTMKATNDTQKATAEAFKAWYDDDYYMGLYDAKTIDIADMGRLNSLAHTHQVTPQQVAENIGYVEPEFFTSPRATTLSEKNAKQAQKVEKNHVRHTFNFFNRSKIKTSSDFFYVKKENGVIEPPRRQIEGAEKKEEKAPVSNVALKALQQKRGR